MGTTVHDLAGGLTRRQFQARVGWWARARRTLVLLAEKEKFKVGVHNHSRLDPNEIVTLEQFEKAMADYPALFVNLDIGHYTAADQDPVRFLDKHHARASRSTSTTGRGTRNRTSRLVKGIRRLVPSFAIRAGQFLPISSMNMADKTPSQRLRSAWLVAARR